MNESFAQLESHVTAAQKHVDDLQRLQPLSPAQLTIVRHLINSLANVNAAASRVKNEHCKMETQWANMGSELT
jgi:hypothetical protein